YEGFHPENPSSVWLALFLSVTAVSLLQTMMVQTTYLREPQHESRLSRLFPWYPVPLPTQGRPFVIAALLALACLNVLVASSVVPFAQTFSVEYVCYILASLAIVVWSIISSVQL